MDNELRSRVQAYLDGRASASELYNWTFANVEKLLLDPGTRVLAGSVLAASWSVLDTSPQDSLRKELREELAKAPR